MPECNHDCANCEHASSCGSKIEKLKLNEQSKIHKVIAVLSGKGGVGKSYVTSLLATNLAKQGYNVGILDADITGPSIPKAFGLSGLAEGDGSYIFPHMTKTGIKVVSSNLLLKDVSDPILWRGSLISNLVQQFYQNVLWEELDYLLIDMPPGTGDVALTTFQMLPVDELIIVTSPQDLVSLIVSKAIKMAEMMNIHVMGVIENMSYIECEDCHKKIYVYGESHLEDFSKQYNFEILGRLPIVPGNAKLIDQGKVELINVPEIEDVINKITK